MGLGLNLEKPQHLTPGKPIIIMGDFVGFTQLHQREFDVDGKKREDVEGKTMFTRVV